MIDLDTLRLHIDSEFDGECRMSSAEARELFDEVERLHALLRAAMAWRNNPRQYSAALKRAIDAAMSKT